MSMRASLLFVAVCALTASAAPVPPPADDPLRPILEPLLQPTVTTLVENYRARRPYQPDDFPLAPDRFAGFRAELLQRLTESLDLRPWTVSDPKGKANVKPHLFRDRLLGKIRYHGIEMEVHLIELPETGDRIPAVICLPDASGPRPAVAVFSGHSKNGLHDLIVNLDSYQSGVAVRLARAGFVSISVEKLDTGYLSHTAPSGVDEQPIASWRLGMDKVTRSVQLMASIAALEMLAAHPRVDETRIGATGVSLGGWLAVQAALLSDRVAAVADFGRKTVFIPEDASPADFTDVRDKCHILPGMFEIGDRNLIPLAYAPRPMLAGHGIRDKGSHEQAPRYYRDLFAAQYEALGKADQFEYAIHEGGDTMPSDTVIDYFRREFNRSER
ncbi:MAG: acetylxylan esterase [Bryobacterales bacterium]|nr:acetylxylan esterase [Bryobacterales bacterium]